MTARAGIAASRMTVEPDASLAFRMADLERDRTVLLDLNISYVSWIGDEIAKAFGVHLPEVFGMSIPDYVAGALDKLCENRPPQGVFYVVERDGVAAGMGGLRPIQPGVVEMKRVYVSPSQRGGGLGAQIVNRLVSDARSFGYATMLLETGPFMTSAHRLYAAAGFADRAPYLEAEVPAEFHARWRFMQAAL